MVLEEGLEPTLLSEPDPKSGASANFAIRALSTNWLSLGWGTRLKETIRVHGTSERLRDDFHISGKALKRMEQSQGIQSDIHWRVNPAFKRK